MPTRPRLPVAALAAAAALLAAIIGCSHPLEVDLPSGYTGKVSIFCDRVGDIDRPVAVAADGTAPHAVCPRSRQPITVLRGGQVIQPASEPQWSTTGDGIVLAVQFDVR